MDEIRFITNIKSEIINPLFSLLFAFGLVFFLYGVWEMVRAADDAAARATGRQHILWGVIGMFIMISFAGIANLICNTISCR